MNLRIVDNFDANFTLDSQAKIVLFELLKQEKFLLEISEKLGGTAVEFTELIFQPVPYSQGTPKGMPPEFEPYYNSPQHAIINVPPTFMFKAKISQPSRLCAIYRKLS